MENGEIQNNNYTTNRNFLKIAGTRIGDSESIFNAENDVIGRFLLAGHSFEYRMTRVLIR